MQTDETFRKQLKTLFFTQNLAALSTQNAGQPYASLVAFYAADDLKHLYFVTPKTTRKFANLAANNNVALLVNSSLNQAADFHKAISVTALGEADEVLGAGGPINLTRSREFELNNMTRVYERLAKHFDNPPLHNNH